MRGMAAAQIATGLWNGLRLATTRMTDRRTFYDERAPLRPGESQRKYHRLLQGYFQFFIPPGTRVLELGCGLGDLLAIVKPSRGVGVDFSPKMIDLARQRHPRLEVQVA